MPKRRRTIGDDDEGESGNAPKRKRRALDVIEICQELYDTIRNHKTDEGRLLCESFVRVPKKRTCAEYYNIVTTPMDLMKIQQKIKMDEYDDVDQMTADMELMIANAKAFYKKSSPGYRDACAIWDLFTVTKNELLDPTSSGDFKKEEVHRSQDSDTKDLDQSNEEEESPYEELFSAVMTAADHDGRLLSAMFQLLPSKTRYPEYYNVIHDPIDLKTIAMRIQNLSYTALNDLEKDLLLMVKNAKTFNEPGSQIYKDAAQLRKLIVNKKYEIDQRKVMPAKTSERISLIISGGQSTLKTTIRRLPVLHTAQAVSISSTSATTPTTSQPTTSCVSRAKKLAVGQKWSTITAALQYESDADEFGQSERSVPSMIVAATLPATPVQSFPPIPQSSASSSCSSFASSAPGTNFSFMAGEDGVEGEEAGNESGPEDADMNPQWQLYETVKNHQAPQGYLLSEPFLRLPSRKLYNDYFREIKQPMSLFKIKTKIKSGGYNSTVEVVDDLNIMFENAKRYNRPDSKLFKDAVKLQKIMQNKARELINYHMKESDSEGDFDDRKKKSKKAINNSPMLVPLKKRMKLLYKTLLDYVDEFNRPLINMFMEKPSRKDYPDYYEHIVNPMDMKTIDCNIKNDRYTSEDQILNDFRLMFNNCRLYNEEGSQIYRDANTLEKVLNARLRELGPLIDVKPKLIMKRHLDLCEDQMGRGRPPHNEHLYKLRTFFETIKEYTDHRGRKLSIVFQKLPSKNDYPDYYEVIKRPMDLDRIGMKLKCTQYEGLEELLSDVILMFDNACKYNEPDSQIYKDALALQRIALQTKLELNDPEDGVPDVKALVQELLTNIFISVYNHQDEEGRCFSDSLVELAETETNNTDNQMPPQKILTLDIIKRNLDRGRYRRLEMFQEEMFEVFERARMISRTDSQAFEDSVELQSFFIKTRDELTKGGQVLQSPALHYTEADLQASVEALRTEKLPNEQLDPEADRSQLGKEEDEDNGEMGSNSLSMRGQTYRIGDFVYVEPREKGMEPHIIHIEKLWKDEQNDPWISGCWFYRPMETFHLATRKFLQQEVFKSDNYNSTPLSQVIGHCFVMFVKDYFKLKPEALEDKDIYVCESRYSAKTKSFKKIKTSWRIPQSDHVNIVPRLEPLEPVRIPSAFKDGVEKPREDSLDLDDGDLTIIDKPKPNIVCDVESPEEGAVYYEQFTLPTGLTVRVGDCCYVRTEHEKSLIARIDKMWLDKNGNAYFHGPWFVTPQEIYHSTTRLFYKQEVFLSTIEDTNPLLSIVGRCSVLDLKDYSTLRPTEIPEDDVYVCEARYFEAERQIRKFPKGLKFLLAPDVMEDEVYYFRKPINPQKTEVFSSSVEVKTPGECTPINPDTENEESLDMPPPSIASKEDSNMSSSTPAPAGKKKSMKKLVTGYIMFAGDMRKGVIQANPDRSFGEISRMIGTEWRNLPEGKKTDYEQRAQRQNEELAATLAREREKEGYDSYPQSPASSQGGGNSNQGTLTPSNPPPVDENTIYECLWDSCEYQFEEMQDLVDHLLTDAKGHIYQTYPNPKGGPDTEYQCLWLNCARIKRNIPPFPNIQRLLRHCREVHLKAAARVVLPEARSKNFIPSRKHTSSPTVTATPTTTTTKGLPSYLLSNRSQSPGMMTGSGGNSTFQSNIPFTPVPLHNHNVNKSHQLGANTPANRHSPYIQQQLNSGSTPVIPFQPVKAPDPIFVATPPKPQKLLHSNTYIKYIEGLQSDNKYIGDWDRQLKATSNNTPNFDSQRLPSQWLANGTVNHGNVVNALWALRNYMMRDALSISKIS